MSLLFTYVSLEIVSLSESALYSSDLQRWLNHNSKGQSYRADSDNEKNHELNLRKLIINRCKEIKMYIIVTCVDFTDVHS